MAQNNEQERKEDIVKEDPSDDIFTYQNSYLNNLTCIHEMTSLVAPILKSKDKERSKRIKELVVNPDSDPKEPPKFKTYDHVKEFLDHVYKIRRADLMFRQGVITSIVSRFDEYIAQILKIAFMQNLNWLKSNEKKISYKEVLEMSSLDSFKLSLVEKEIDALMRDSHLAQIQFMDSKLKLGIESEFNKFKQFLEITERRNLFSHTGGCVSSIYIENMRKWEVPEDPKVKEGTLLSASNTYIAKAIDCFYELSVRITQAVARRLFINCYERADLILNNQGVDLLSQERYELAERIFQFALGIPDKMSSGGETKYYFIINLCIAEKCLGKDYQKRLNSIDWSPFHPKYHFAINVLKDNYDVAKSLMYNQSVKESIDEQCYKDWPLLREFRKTEQFKSAFHELYGKDIEEEMIKDAEKAIEEHDIIHTEGDKEVDRIPCLS